MAAQNFPFVFDAEKLKELFSAAKLPVYGGYALLDRRALVIAISLGAIMMVGGLIGGAIARRVSDRFFVVAIEVLIAVGGVGLLIWA